VARKLDAALTFSFKSLDAARTTPPSLYVKRTVLDGE